MLQRGLYPVRRESWLLRQYKTCRSKTIFINRRKNGPIFSIFRNSNTLPVNINGINEIKQAISEPLKTACYRLKKLGKYSKNIQIKLRYGDFKTITRAKQLQYPINTLQECYKEVCTLLEEKVDCYDNIGLVGVRLSSLTEEKTVQFSLFSDNSKWEKKNRIDDITFELRKKYGYNIIKDCSGVN